MRSRRASPPPSSPSAPPSATLNSRLSAHLRPSWPATPRPTRRPPPRPSRRRGPPTRARRGRCPPTSPRGASRTTSTSSAATCTASGGKSRQAPPPHGTAARGRCARDHCPRSALVLAGAPATQQGGHANCPVASPAASPAASLPPLLPRRHHVAGVETLADCRAACAAARAEGCAAFTLTKATGFCWLKNTSHTAAAQNRTKGLVSGLMSAAR